jgi:hypothetical protein
MSTSKGVVQGYTGIAIADGKHQVIVNAEAFGEGQEQGVLVPMLEATRTSFEELDLSGDILKEIKLTADAGYSSEANAAYLAEHQIDAYVADTNFRKRDPRFADAARHKPIREDEPFAKPKRDLKFRPKDFTLAEDHSHAICPAGKRLYKCGHHRDLQGLQTIKFRAPMSACRECPLRTQCLRHPQRTQARQVAFITGEVPNRPERHLARMKRRIDSEIGRYEYSRRLGTIEPVFGNIRHAKRLNRFTLRGKRKVNAQWRMFCLVHNIEKLQRYGQLNERVMRRRRAA